jgi:hypothetical protein
MVSDYKINQENVISSCEWFTRIAQREIQKYDLKAELHQQKVSDERKMKSL